MGKNISIHDLSWKIEETLIDLSYCCSRLNLFMKHYEEVPAEGNCYNIRNLIEKTTKILKENLFYIDWAEIGEEKEAT